MKTCLLENMQCSYRILKTVQSNHTINTIQTQHYECSYTTMIVAETPYLSKALTPKLTVKDACKQNCASQTQLNTHLCKVKTQKKKKKKKTNCVHGLNCISTS